MRLIGNKLIRRQATSPQTTFHHTNTHENGTSLCRADDSKPPIQTPISKHFPTYPRRISSHIWLVIIFMVGATHWWGAKERGRCWV